MITGCGLDSYGIHRSMRTSGGLTGSGGCFSMITERGGIGMGGSLFLITRAEGKRSSACSIRIDLLGIAFGTFGGRSRKINGGSDNGGAGYCRTI
jgi:hypothetical protein